MTVSNRFDIFLEVLSSTYEVLPLYGRECALKGFVSNDYFIDLLGPCSGLSGHVCVVLSMSGEYRVHNHNYEDRLLWVKPEIARDRAPALPTVNVLVVCELENRN